MVDDRNDFAPATANLDTTMGTRARIEETLSTIDQEGLGEMIDRATRVGSGPKFISKFRPGSSWLWSQWQGTVLQHTWMPAVIMMSVSSALVLAMEVARKDGKHTWSILEVPDPEDAWVARMRGFTTMWGYLLTMATFVNSFFLSQAYGFWLATKGNVRKVQGRLNDLGMLAATHAQRDGSTGRIAPASMALLEDIARWGRLYHMLFWSGQVCTSYLPPSYSLTTLLPTSHFLLRIHHMSAPGMARCGPLAATRASLSRCCARSSASRPSSSARRSPSGKCHGIPNPRPSPLTRARCQLQ